MHRVKAFAFWIGPAALFAVAWWLVQFTVEDSGGCLLSEDAVCDVHSALVPPAIALILLAAYGVYLAFHAAAPEWPGHKTAARAWWAAALSTFLFTAYVGLFLHYK